VAGQAGHGSCPPLGSAVAPGDDDEQRSARHPGGSARLGLFVFRGPEVDTGNAKRTLKWSPLTLRLGFAGSSAAARSGRPRV
jgi:hypothetical protein